MKETKPMPSDYITYARQLYKISMGCLIDGQLAMFFGFRKRPLMRAASAGKSVLFATDQWTVTLDFKTMEVRIEAPNTDVGHKLLPA